MKSFLRLIVIIILNSQLSILNCSCSKDTYDKGDGQYSYLRGDFAEALVGADKEIVSLITDEGETLPLLQPYAAKWITRSVAPIPSTAVCYIIIRYAIARDNMLPKRYPSERCPVL